MKRILSFSLTFLLAISFISMSITPNLLLAQTVQEKLTNQAVIDMVKAGLSAEIIIAKIKSSPSGFDTSSEALQTLKKAGVSDSIVLTMVKKESGLSEEIVANAGLDSAITTEVKLPDGTEVKLVTIDEISSKKAIQDDPLTFKVAEDVKVNGKIVVAKDTIAKGIVTNAKKKSMMGRSGELSIRLESTQTVDGQKVKLRSSKSGEGGDNTTSTVVLTVLFGPLGLLKRGKDAVIKSGTIV
ncbi:MAG: hypothetical protein M3Q33_10755, partial [Acidobacteriota bacterium]|nr:hypothetical protein [Acidobacteriota bacterium]